ncbi:U1 snRNP-associated protein usp106-like isoform X2 [Hordeum vulgare subsp. vulgare]|uniref:U1 snRNP-associated protein usp106-like isoform X2 n=1 Tax=Hordeum vulgare subsp. vulgare TaxID=112509 RepID=UPI001D1A3564|nr:U1 snRNP-associated protein usp106-like isoform X2 [Hordeum vulgare subsp. vulgare]
MDAMRKQLDVLMGANRNGDVREVNRKYFDRDVCRLFLAGLCPHDLFQLTKMDLGPCPKVHSLQLRKDYEEVKAKGSENFDRELEDMIDRLIVECERKIQRALKRLADEDAKAAIAISVSEVTQSEEVAQLSKEIKEKMKEADIFDFEGKTDDKIKTMELVEELRSKRADMQATLLLDAFNKDRAAIPVPIPAPQMAALPAPPPPDARTQELINEKLSKAEALGEQGMVEEAQKALEEAEALKKLAAARQEPVADPAKYSVADVRITDQKLRLCDICGAFLSVYDNDRRLADHFGGKLHLGYMLIREKLKELQEERTKKDEKLKMTDEKTAGTTMGGLPGIEMQKERTELSLGKAEETMIGIVIGAMTGTVAMTVTGIEGMTAPVAVTHGEGNDLGPGSAAGATRDIESVAPWLADSGGVLVFLHDSDGAF